MLDKPRDRHRIIPKFVYNCRGLKLEFIFGDRKEIWRIIMALVRVWIWSFVTRLEEVGDAKP